MDRRHFLQSTAAVAAATPLAAWSGAQPQGAPARLSLVVQADLGAAIGFADALTQSFAAVDVEAHTLRVAANALSDARGVADLLAATDGHPLLGLLDDAHAAIVDALAGGFGPGLLARGVHRLGGGGGVHRVSPIALGNPLMLEAAGRDVRGLVLIYAALLGQRAPARLARADWQFSTHGHFASFLLTGRRAAGTQRFVEIPA